MKKAKIVVVAHRIRSLYNVGSIFRTCDGIGAEKLYLTGYTATPKTQPIRLHKTALGAEETVPWEFSRNITPVINKLKKQGYKIIGLEEKEGKSKDYRKWQPKGKIAIILGNEINGISDKTLSKCNEIISLPMAGQKVSLNVSVAFGAIAYYIISKVDQS